MIVPSSGCLRVNIRWGRLSAFDTWQSFSHTPVLSKCEHRRAGPCPLNLWTSEPLRVWTCCEPISALRKQRYYIDMWIVNGFKVNKVLYAAQKAQTQPIKRIVIRSGVLTFNTSAQSPSTLFLLSTLLPSLQLLQMRPQTPWTITREPNG